MRSSRDDSFSDRTRIRSCALVVKEGKLLLVKQQAPTRSYPIWLSPGGEITFGESAAKAAKRETHEETGLTIRITHLAAVNEFIELPYHAIELYFLATQTGGELITGMDPELSEADQQILDCKFIKFEDLENLPVFPDFLKKNLRKMLKSDAGIMHFDGNNR